MVDECPSLVNNEGILRCYCPHNMCGRVFDGLAVSFLLGPSRATHCVLHLESDEKTEYSFHDVRAAIDRNGAISHTCSV